jgi:hypothetical protein
MMDVNLLLYLFLFRIDEPKNLTAEKNRRGGRISRGKHTQLNSVECMIFLVFTIQQAQPLRSDRVSAKFFFGVRHAPVVTVASYGSTQAGGLPATAQ